MKNDKQIIDIIQVALPLPVRRQFDYTVPQGIPAERLPGCRVLVPFGKRILTGYITATGKAEATGKHKPIVELLDDEPAFSEEMLSFTKWMGEYYMCSWGEVLKAALPSGMSPKSVIRVNINPDVRGEMIDSLERTAPKSAEILKILFNSADFVTVGYLESLMKTDSIAAQLELLRRRGMIEIEKTILKDASVAWAKAARIGEALREDEQKIREILRELDNKNIHASIMLSTIYLHENSSPEPMFLTELLKNTGLKRHTLNSLVKKGFVEIYEAEKDRSKIIDSGESLISGDESGLVLNEEQQAAVDSVGSAVGTGKYKAFLMHGVTGSGKTLVYINAIRKALSAGLSSILTVPEISLTPQLIDRFSAAFDGRIAVIHSRMTQGERYDSWKAVREGRVQVVIGARSAVFSPAMNLGLIIVDEEHEPSYKQDAPAPRYNARDAAVARASLGNAVVVLGSATPSIESMYNAENGKYTLLKLTRRADGASMPAVRIVDTAAARKYKRMSGSFSEDLIEAIIDRINRKEGVILFRNRRGFSSFLECDDCAYIPKCIHCSVSLTYHKVKNQLRCHQCGYTIGTVGICPECGGTSFIQSGSGTQKIEEELKEALAAKGYKPSIFRMDLDTTSGKNSHRKILHKFSSGIIDILVGTQMIAKGLDFDRVTLVGVIDSDNQMFIPDFRAYERTFQLLTQVSGRAGRKSDKPGQVIIQTSHPDADPIVFTVNNSYNDFYKKELNTRRSAGYPPFSRYVVIEFKGKNQDKVNAMANNFAGYIVGRRQFYDVLGPVEPVISKLRDYYRKTIIIKNFKDRDPNGRQLRLTLEDALMQFAKNNTGKSDTVTIDIDSVFRL